MLIKRVVTAMILFALVLFAMFTLKPLSWTLLVGAITLLAGWEWARLSGIKIGFVRLFFVFFLATLFLFSMRLPLVWMFVPSVAVTVLSPLLLRAYARSKPWALWLVQSTVFRLCLGVVALVPCLLAISFLNFYQERSLWLLTLFLIIFGADVGAYFVGTRFGKRHLIEPISPNKTWEGVWGGLGVALIMALIMSQRLHLSAGHLVVFLLLSLLTAGASIIGDLNESLLKRQEKLKDSGHLLPGHGGLLDRIDSLTTAAPLFALCVLWFGLGG